MDTNQHRTALKEIELCIIKRKKKTGRMDEDAFAEECRSTGDVSRL